MFDIRKGIAVYSTPELTYNEKRKSNPEIYQTETTSTEKKLPHFAFPPLNQTKSREYIKLYPKINPVLTPIQNQAYSS